MSNSERIWEASLAASVARAEKAEAEAEVERLKRDGCEGTTTVGRDVYRRCCDDRKTLQESLNEAEAVHLENMLKLGAAGVDLKARAEKAEAEVERLRERVEGLRGGLSVITNLTLVPEKVARETLQADDVVALCPH